MTFSSLVNRQTAAQLIAAAATELFPGILLAGGRGTSICFYYDFIFPFPYNADFLPLIEERIRLLIREKRSIQTLEMMPQSAAALLLHRGQKVRADQLLLVQNSLVQMCQIGEWIDFCPFPFEEKIDLTHFKLLRAESLEFLEPQRIRIIGIGSAEKNVVKAAVKHSHFSFHWNLGKQTRLFEPMREKGFWYWLPKGEVFKNLLLSWWRKEHSKQDFHIIHSPISFLDCGNGTDFLESHREYACRFAVEKVAEIGLIAQREEVGEGFFSPKVVTVDQAHLFCSEEKLLQESISSLQFILKIPKILGFECEIILSVSSSKRQKNRSSQVALLRAALEQMKISYLLKKGAPEGVLAGIDVCLFDSLGRKWAAPFIHLLEKEGPIGRSCILSRSTFGSLERMTALILEKNEGWLPLSFAPEQVRILVLADCVRPYAQQVLNHLEEQGIRAGIEDREDKLKARLYQAFLEKIPYIVLLGQREENKKEMTVRAYGENIEQSMPLDKFCMKLKAEMGEWKL